MIRKISILILMFLIGLVLFFNMNFFLGKNKVIIEESYIEKHNGVIISEILNEDNYKKAGINPNNYISFESFLKDFKTFSGVLVDPINEKFVIGLRGDDESTIYIPFDLKNSDNIFDNKQNKDLAILDIYSAYKDDSIYGGVDSEYGMKILFEDDLQHPKTAILKQIFDVNLFDQGNNVFNIIDSLEKSDEIGVGNTELLAYLYDFTGDYKKSFQKRDSICVKYKQDCNEEINVKITGKVLDNKTGKPLSGVLIELLNDKSINSKTDAEGNYSFDFEYFPFSHLRFKSSLHGYSDGFATVSLNNIYSDNEYLLVDFKIEKAGNMITINDNNSSEYKKGKYYIFDVDNSKYFVPIDGLYYKNGKSYTKSNFDVFTYLFTKSSNMDSMLENDTFEPVYGYVGNIMKTFGMPYIQFVDNETGEELFIKSSNPMILQNQIHHMQELYDNHDKIYEKLTDEDMNFLVEKSEELGGYPIDFDFLTQNHFLRWPAWWALDRITGVWSNVGSRVINEGGLVELPFFHIKDN